MGGVGATAHVIERCVVSLISVLEVGEMNKVYIALAVLLSCFK